MDRANSVGDAVVVYQTREFSVAAKVEKQISRRFFGSTFEGNPDQKNYAKTMIGLIKLAGRDFAGTITKPSQQAACRLSLPAVKTFCVFSQDSVLGLIGDVLPAANR